MKVNQIWFVVLTALKDLTIYDQWQRAGLIGSSVSLRCGGPGGGWLCGTSDFHKRNQFVYHVLINHNHNLFLTLTK